MNEVRICAVSESLQVGTHGLSIKVGLQREQSFQTEYGVIKITATRTIFKSPIGVLLRPIECPHELGRITQHLGCEPRHLQHFKAQAHGLKALSGTAVL